MLRIEARDREVPGGGPDIKYQTIVEAAEQGLLEREEGHADRE